MKEIRIALANVLFRLNAYIADIECDIDMKKYLLDIINLEKQAEMQ